MPQTFSSLSGESPRLLLGAQKGQPQSPLLPPPASPTPRQHRSASLFWQCYHEAGAHASTETTQKAIQSVPLQISHWSPKKKNNFWTRGVKNEEEFEIWRLFKLSKIASSQKLDLPSFHSPPYPAKKKKNSYLYLRKSGPWRLVLLLWKDKPQDGFHIISL